MAGRVEARFVDREGKPVEEAQCHVLTGADDLQLAAQDREGLLQPAKPDNKKPAPVRDRPW